LRANIIGRESGRSAIGASAYRAGEKLRAVEKASYRSGERLRDKDAKMVHDYRYHHDVVYTEIMLPENAPKEFSDRETLWNAVEKNERRRDAQLVREIVVAIPKEFEFEQQVEVMQEYILENFISEGMIADLAIHNKGNGNPHAHIMLTMREVTPDGFGLKNRAWNKPDYLKKWRKSWTEVNNRKFMENGILRRIDHRSYKDRGIDKVPMIHFGHKAWALEKKGVRTRKGDYNRAVRLRNRKRAETNESEIEAPEHKKGRARKRIAFRTNNLREKYAEIEDEICTLKDDITEDKSDILCLQLVAEEIDEHVKNVRKLRNRAEALRLARERLFFVRVINGVALDREIARVDLELERSLDFLGVSIMRELSGRIRRHQILGGIFVLGRKGCLRGIRV
jgi:ATP-dependent exoDNAse (exonuclease V) alpha subunit